MIRKILFVALLAFILCAFGADNKLNGNWEYSGGIYNGKPEAPSKDYKLLRQYDDAHYTALFIEKDAEPITYEKGDYILKQDTCLETQTFSAQPSKLLSITLRYRYRLKNDTLTLNGVLPNGTVVQEYWKRIK
ncbi:hypothetical protein [Mucilaginibacter phyllosphaerae]|uniref:Lipocalin-like domain-containing protein n=1 Tax=Mucilaginibacter phyllosphaerae TaxID=1812349 RepID=A0A4Y8A8F6_9SPHI|nr:hypothetical protein [Mucilaginibacter phyllosphaerae]MBB3970922.1 hypothetical protein [Mucilaginibacter phyllosphaerae]TEW64144.1 hypothetical protein E2R65_17505 [Mucilaginibacter phyllosphaerae]GGH05453.1 hypothetical protein GCM10007352_09230 [Mucilaginibacter phyllosphaerae]